MTYPTIEDFVGNTPLVRLQRLPGETDNLILVKLEGNNPAGLGQGPTGAEHDPSRRGAGHHQARGHPDRGHQRQHRDRAGHGRGDPGLPDGADHARAHERGAARP